MAPTAAEVEEKIADMIAKAPGSVWSYDSLVRILFRGLKSTPQYVEKQLYALEEEGKLVRVVVRASGFVSFPDESERLNSGMNIVYFHGRNSLSSGTMSYARPKDRGHLWAGDAGRYYYTSKAGYAAIRAELLASLEDRTQRALVEKQKKEDETRSALVGLAEDAPELLRRLSEALGEEDAIYPRVSGGEIGVTLSLMGNAGVTTFLDILRRGLKESEH